jgi:hypothetical protein
MKAIYTLFFVILLKSICAQSTVHLSILEEGRGILRSRGNECFIIAPYHLVDGAENRQVVVTGDNQKVSQGKYIKQYPGDIAIIKIEGGASQGCTEWDIVKSFTQLLNNTFEGFLEIRNDDGSFDHEPMYLKRKTDQGITIQAKDANFEFSKGMSGSSLFSNINGVKTYLGMLLSTDDNNNKIGNVFQADDMDRIMGEFFIGPLGVKTKEVSTQSVQFANQFHEEAGFNFELIKAKKSGDKIVLSFSITSTLKDDINYFHRQGTKIYDQNGIQIEASSIKLANQNNPNYGGWDFTFPKGVSIPYQITFNGCENFETISLLEMMVLNGKIIKFKNLTLEGVNTVSSYNIPKVIIKSHEEAGFNFELIKAKKSGDKIVLSFSITSTLKDDINYFHRQGTKIYDQNGIQIEASSIKLANQNNPNYGGWDFTFPKGVSIPYEITFNGCENFETISLLEMMVLNGKIIKFKNLTLEGVNTVSSYNIPKVIIKSHEEAGFNFELIKAKKSGDKIVLSFSITSTLKDDINYFHRQGTKIYDQNGIQIEASSIKLANQNNPNYGGWDFTFPKGVSIPYEITFNGCENFETISLLEMMVLNGKIIKFKNLTLEGVNTVSSYNIPKVIIKSHEEAGFNFELIKAKKSGDKIVLSFSITSTLKDDINYFHRQGTKIYDQNGIQIEASSIKLANQNNPNYGGWDFTFPKGVSIPYEITFNGCENFETITLLEMMVLNGKILKFRNIPIN